VARSASIDRLPAQQRVARRKPRRLSALPARLVWRPGRRLAAGRGVWRRLAALDPRL